MDEQPFPREPWQQLLRDRGGAPPETTDARIRAAARRALAPRAARWWLPASLAASVLLAVLIVQWQYGDREPPAVVTEADIARPAAPAEPAPRFSRSDEPPPSTASQRTAKSAERAPPALVDLPEFEPQPEPLGSEERATAPAARIGGPERDMKESSEMTVDDVQENAPATAIYQEAAAKLRKPEDWYAEIEEMRAAGRVEEAERELERLKKAYPGWLERHVEDAKRR